jgi:hypothetical protein
MLVATSSAELGSAGEDLKLTPSRWLRRSARGLLRATGVRARHGQRDLVPLCLSSLRRRCGESLMSLAFPAAGSSGESAGVQQEPRAEWIPLAPATPVPHKLTSST